MGCTSSKPKPDIDKQAPATSSNRPLPVQQTEGVASSRDRPVRQQAEPNQISDGQTSYVSSHDPSKNAAEHCQTKTAQGAAEQRSQHTGVDSEQPLDSQRPRLLEQQSSNSPVTGKAPALQDAADSVKSQAGATILSTAAAPDIASPAKLKYNAQNPHHLHYSQIENPTTAMVDVEADGHVVLHASSGRTDFKGLKDFEDLERQEANKSILQCFGCDPKSTHHETRFDSITQLLASIFTMPVALVVFLDGDLAYIRGEKGMSQAEPTSRGLSFCTWTLVTLKPEVQVIPDTLRDGRFKTHPYVTGLPHLRFYAGAPLISSRGHRLGSLCLADYKPRTFDAECCSILCNFAEIVVRDAERFAQEQLQSVQQWAVGSTVPQTLSASSNASDILPVRDLPAGETTNVALLDTSDPGWPMLFAGEGFTSCTGVHVGMDAKVPFWGAFWTPGNIRSSMQSANGSEAYADQVRHGATFHIEVITAILASDATCFVRFTPAAMEMLDNKQVPININIPGKFAKAVEINPAAYYFATVHLVDGVRSSNNSSSSSSMATHDPQQEVPFDDVQLGGLLGKGSFGSVYLGLCSGEAVAVKVVEHKALQVGATANGKTAKEELEATLGLELDHPNIVRTIKFATVQRAARKARRRYRLQTDSLGSGLGSGGSSGGAGSSDRTDRQSTDKTAKGRMETWIVLSLCDQGSLQAAIDEGAYRSTGNSFVGAPDVEKILVTATEIASAMDYLHTKGILHGDLTANNILLATLGGVHNLEGTPPSQGDELLPGPPIVAKVSDFGLSRVTSAESVMSTNTFGTVTHMPPELLKEGHLSAAVDVYAYGVLMWEMYVGERPWAGMRPVTIILKKTQGKAKLLWPNGTPSAYQALADDCMSSDPKQRPTFPKIMQRLAQLNSDAAKQELQPSDGFAVYHGWQKLVDPLPHNLSPPA